MNAELSKIFNYSKFFHLHRCTENRFNVSLEVPSKLLMQNIYLNWLKSIWNKAENNFPVSLKPVKSLQIPYGTISSEREFIQKDVALNFDHKGYNTDGNSKLIFTLVIRKQESMPYFIQWQRYRKYWWSSITTTPSIFHLNDIKYKENTAEVDIVVKLPWDELAVEKISIETSDLSKYVTLKCETNLNDALVVALADGTVSSTEEGYLRLHRDIAPYKFSFALESSDTAVRSKLIDLAKLLHRQLASKNISALFPSFLPYDEQVADNLRIGVVYSVVLSEKTLHDGILHLLNSSTMLMEQVHIADLESYAQLLSGK